MKLVNSIIPLVILLFFFLPALYAQHTILLKDGRTLKGNITSQDADSLSLESKDGKKMSVPKANLLKVIYKKVDEAEEEKIRKEEEEKLSLKQKQEEEHIRLKNELRKKELEEKRKEFDEKRLAVLDEREKSLEEKKRKAESSRKLGSPEQNFKTQYEFYQLFSGAKIQLAPVNAKCSDYGKSSDWYVLFGSIPITRPDMESLLPKDNRKVRVRAENSWLDIGVSVVLGIAGSVTRRTIVVEACDSGKVEKTFTQEELDLELEKQKYQLESEFMREKEELLY
ncbi:MAG: hypothetical protein JJT78_11855 [Leptospira sp.]|nr:hypothetical protein [Leptospira sp.]